MGFSLWISINWILFLLYSIQEIVGSVLKLLKLSAIAKNKLNKVSVGNNFPLAINLVIRLSHVAITNAFKTVIQGININFLICFTSSFKKNQLILTKLLDINRPCDECKLDPDEVDTCPCGKISLLTLTGGNFRESCADPIPICGGPCKKIASCGIHTCKLSCHEVLKTQNIINKYLGIFQSL